MEGFDIVVDQGPKILSAFWQSGFLTVVKFILGVYVIVILIDLVLLLSLRGLSADYRVLRMGANIPAASKGKMTKRWEKIKSRLESGNISQYKVAILEADKFADEILGGVGYEGKNMGEKLEKVKPGQLNNIEGLQKAHQVRNKIVYEKDFTVDEKMAKEMVEVFEEMLKNLEFIS